MGDRIEYGPVVLNGDVRYTSPTATERFDPESYGGCPRRWFLHYVKKEPEAVQIEHKVGQEVHKQIEHYLKTNENVLGDIARPGAHFIPARGDDLLIEHPIGDLQAVVLFENIRARVASGERVTHLDTYQALVKSCLTAAEVPFVGYVDLRHSRGEYIDPEGNVRPEAHARTVEVIDWKTSGSIEQWAKSAEKLANTIQMVGYAEWASRSGLFDFFRLSHVYFQTKRPFRSEKRSALLDLETVKQRWARIEGVVRRMRDVAHETDYLKVECNTDSCGAYKGCSYRHLCPHDAKKALINIFGKGTAMGLLDSLNKLQPSTSAAAPASSPAPQVQLEMEKLKTEEATIKAGIVPPDATQTTPATAAKPVAPESMATLPPAVQEAAKVQAAAVAAANPAPAPVVEDKPKKGRPAGSKNKKTKTSEPMSDPGYSILPDGKTMSLFGQLAVDFVQKVHGIPLAAGATYNTTVEKFQAAGFTLKTETTPPPTAQQNIPAVLAASPAAGLSLYVDVLARGLGLIDLDPYVQELCRQLEAEYHAADIRCAPQDSPLGYGKWEGALAGLIRAQPPAPGAYVILDASMSNIRRCVVDALKPLCSVFVRGIR